MILLTRREVLANAACLALSVAASWTLSPTNAQELSADGATIERWIKQSFSGSRKETYGGEYLGRFLEPMYYLRRPINWEPNPDQSQLIPVHVPVGFVTDFGSVPRAYWSFLRPDPFNSFPALIHEYLYWTQVTTRDMADDIFRAVLEELDIGVDATEAIYREIRLLGIKAWEKNGLLRSQGEKRILRRFPDSPSVKWEEWKKRPDVFA